MEGDMIPKQTAPDRLGPIYAFFCWCSGARLYLLKKCPTEFNKFMGIGVIVFFTGTLAALTGGYAMYTVFNNIWISFALGLFWGLLIFFLDWYIVSSLRKENNLGKELLSATPRLILSVFLAVVISKPLELRLFQNEILKEIEFLKRDSEINYQDKVFEEFDEIGHLEKENVLLQQNIRDKEGKRLELFQIMMEEAEGRSPTQRMGKGSVYKEKKMEYDRVSKELEQLNNTYLPQIQNNMQRVNQLKAIRDEKLKKGYQATEQYNGFLARLEALGSMTERNRYIHTANVFLVLLFILLESSPVLVKLMSKRGPYDVLLDAEELSGTYQTEKEISQKNASLNELLVKNRYGNQLKKETGKKVARDYFFQLQEAGMAINKEKIDRWKEKQSQHIKDNFEEESQRITKSLNTE
jgi:hypothetical protein